MERCWVSGGPDWLFALVLDLVFPLGLGGLTLVLSPLYPKQPRPRPVGKVRVWTAVFLLAFAVRPLVGLGFPGAVRTLGIYAAVFGVVLVALRLAPRPDPAAKQYVRLWPVSRTNLSVWLGAVMLTAAAGVWWLPEALGHPCA